MGNVYLRSLSDYAKNPYIKEEQTTQWPKEKLQKDKQRSTKHTHKTKDRVTRITRTPLKISCFTGKKVILKKYKRGALKRLVHTHNQVRV